MSGAGPMPERLRRALGIRDIPEPIRQQWLKECAAEDAAVDAAIAAEIAAQPPLPKRRETGKAA